MQRLAIAYLRTGNSQKAQPSLVRVIELYGNIGLSYDHPCYAMARNDLERLPQGSSRCAPQTSKMTSSRRLITDVEASSDSFGLLRLISPSDDEA